MMPEGCSILFHFPNEILDRHALKWIRKLDEMNRKTNRMTNNSKSKCADHKPNTCPTMVEESADEVVSKAVTRITNAVNSFEMWPKEGKDAVAKAVSKGMAGESQG